MTYDSIKYPSGQSCTHVLRDSAGNEVAQMIYTILGTKYHPEKGYYYYMTIRLIPINIEKINYFSLYNYGCYGYTTGPIWINGSKNTVGVGEYTFYDGNINVSMGTSTYCFKWPRIKFDYNPIPIPAEPPKLEDFIIHENTWFMRKDGIIKSEILGLEYSVDNSKFIDFFDIAYLNAGVYYFRIKATEANKESTSIKIEVPYVPYSKQLYVQIIQTIRQYL